MVSTPKCFSQEQYWTHCSALQAGNTILAIWNKSIRKKRTCWTIQCVTFLLVVCYMFISLISPHQPLHAHGRGQESREQLPLWLDVIAYSVGVVRTHRAILWITSCWAPYLSLAKRAQRVYLEPFIYAFHVEDMCTGKFTQIFIVWELRQADAANLQIPNNQICCKCVIGSMIYEKEYGRELTASSAEIIRSLSVPAAKTPPPSSPTSPSWTLFDWNLYATKVLIASVVAPLFRSKSSWTPRMDIIQGRQQHIIVHKMKGRA